MKQINLPIAAKDSQKIDLSNRHIGTTDFFRPFLNYAIETVAKDKIKANIKTFVQGYPLAGANLGQFTHSVHAFFNPYRTVMTDWVDFIAGNECRYFAVDHEPTHGLMFTNVNNLVVGKRESVPLISRNDIFYLFLNHLQRFDPSYYNETTNSLLRVQTDTDMSKLTFSVMPNPLIYAYAINAAGASAFENYSLDHDIVNSGDESIIYVQKGSKFDIIGDVYNPLRSTTYHIGIYLSPYGRLVYQLLRSLGYKRNFGATVQNSKELPDFTGGYYAQVNYQNENMSEKLEEFSALPLLSLYKIFIDWYVPSKFRNNYDKMLSIMSMLQYPFREMHPVDDFHLTRPYPLLQEVILYTSYANDYFTNAFLYPNGSNDGETEGFNFPDITAPHLAEFDSLNSVKQDHSESPSSNSTNSPYLNQAGGDYSDPVRSLTSYALRALRALNNYVRRNQIVGYRSIDRILARWGVKLDYVQTNRSVLIKSNSNDFFPENVVSNADTHASDVVASPESQQALLGGRSSNLIFGTDLKVDFDTDEVGIFVVLSSVYPKVGYVQGIDRMIIHKKLDDFYIPEFDSLGVQPILFDELFADAVHGSVNRSGSIFGYTVRYADYKYKQDDLSGDFILPSRNAFLESLHTFRIFDKDNAPTSINNKFLIGNGAEYDRVFAMYTDDYDHLQVASYNEVDVQRRVDSAADVKDITDGSGQYYNTPVGGSHTIR